MKRCLFLLFAVIISACAAEKPAVRQAPADSRPYPEGLYANDAGDSVVFFKVNKHSPRVRMQSLEIGDDILTADNQMSPQSASAPPAKTDSICPLPASDARLTKP